MSGTMGMKPGGTTAVALTSKRAGWGRGLIASFPRSVCIATDGGPPDLAVIDGTGDWLASARERLDRGVTRILVIEPRREDPAAVIALADALDGCGAELRLGETFAGNPAIAGFRDVLGMDPTEIVLDGCDDDPPRAILFTHVRLMRAIGLTKVSLSGLQLSGAACIADGRGLLSGAEVCLRLTGATCGVVSARHVVTAFGQSTMARLMLHGGGEARPAEVSVTTPAGRTVLPAIHHGAHRHALQRMLQGNAGEGSTALRDFSDDLLLAETIPNLA